MLKKAVGVALALSLAAPMASADETFGAKLGYRSLTPSGQISGSLGLPGAAFAKGTSVDVKNDLKLGKSNQVTGEIFANLGDSRIGLEFIPMSFDGNSTLGKAVVFNNVNFAAGSAVRSSFKADYYDLAYTYNFLNMDDSPARVQLGVEACLKVVRVRASLQSGAAASNTSFTAPVPTLGLRGRVALGDMLGVVGRVGYMSTGSTRVGDYDAQVEFSPVPLFGGYAGYRYIGLKSDISSAFSDVRFAGPYAGLMARF